jgi:hypothetical protein
MKASFSHDKFAAKQRNKVFTLVGKAHILPAIDALKHGYPTEDASFGAFPKRQFLC